MSHAKKAGSKGSSNERVNAGLTPIGSVAQGLFSHLLVQQPEIPESPAEPASKTSSGPKSKAIEKRAAAAAEIARQPDQAEAAYLARELVQCTLPLSDPGDVPVWVRTNGNFSLAIQPGFDAKSMKPVGLPYGSIPRLLLVWIVSEAVRTRSRHIKLGSSLNDFLREIGLNPKTGGGKRSDAKRLKEQCLRLLHCRISFHYSDGDAQKGSGAFVNMELAREARYWWDFTSPDQDSLFESELVLGEVFYQAITARPVPLDFRALRALKQSPLAIDVYIWVTYRVFRLQQSGTPEVSISLQDLSKQFGAQYKRLDNFKAAIGEALEKIQEVYPALDYSLTARTLTLRDGQGRPAVKPQDKELAKRRLAGMQPYNIIKPKTREWFLAALPGYDIETAIQDFNQWREKQQIEAANVDALFRKFAKTWAKR